MFLGAWWIITSFLMKIFANGDLSTFGRYFPIYFDNEIAIILLLIGIGYVVEQFRIESQLGLTRKEQIESYSSKRLSILESSHSFTPY